MSDTTTPTKNESLPELPGPVFYNGPSNGYTKTQMEAYGQQCYEAALTREAPTEGVSDALRELLHAVCGETGFAAAVRSHSGLAYPWPALDAAEKQALKALAATPPAPQRQSSNPSGLSSESVSQSSELRLEQGEVPDGWRLVPIEPTWDMRNEGREFLIDGLEKNPEKLAYFLWKTMVAAAPEVK